MNEIKKEQKQGLNNKGFSLVELIIVIAIMAILVGVLAPQLLRYVEKTNVSADTQLADAIKTAVTTAIMDPAVMADGSATTFTTAHATAATLSTSAADEFLKSVNVTLGFPAATTAADLETGLIRKLKSAHGTGAAINVTVNSANSVTVTLTQTDNTGGKDITAASSANDIKVGD